MTFSDLPIDEPFKDGGVTYEKLTEATAEIPGTASGPKRHWRIGNVYEFDADDEVEEWGRWRMS